MRNLNEKMREIFEKAIENIKDSNQNLLKPEHVLLQIMYDGNNEATKLLEELGIDTSKITGELEESVESQYGVYYGFSDQIYVSSELSYVLELARREARLFNQKVVQPKGRRTFALLAWPSQRRQITGCSDLEKT